MTNGHWNDFTTIVFRHLVSGRVKLQSIMDADRETLLSFGYPARLVDEALKNTNNSGLELALDWLGKHEDGAVETSGTKDEKALDSDVAMAPSESPAGQAKTLKCTDCNKIFKNQDLASYHADKSGHINFEESTEEIKPATEEEKALRLAELRCKMEQKREQRRAADHAQEIENQRLRIKGGKEQAAAKQELELRAAAKEAAQKKKDKIEEAAARNRVKKQIEEDKQRRLEKAAHEKAKREGVAPSVNTTPSINVSQSSMPSSKPSVSSTSAKVYEKGRLQLKLPDQNKSIVLETKPDQTLVEIVDMLFAHPDFTDSARLEKRTIKFSTSYPRKTFSDSEMAKSVKDLGLLPAVVLMVSYN
ncbi:hypothetical protein DFH28DRAFT_959297 [Melampsora americana]|nr:hypothetical protein DFH28DRAFT_959297 [Melampsora americana]